MRYLTKALWTKELEVELVQGNVDAIVHCLKDMPTDVRVFAVSTSRESQSNGP